MEHLIKGNYPNKVKLGYYFKHNGGVDIYTEIDEVDSDWIDWCNCFDKNRIVILNDWKNNVKEIINMDGSKGKYTNFKYEYQEDDNHGLCLMSESFLEKIEREWNERKERMDTTMKILELFFSDKLTDKERDYILRNINLNYNGSSED